MKQRVLTAIMFTVVTIAAIILGSWKMLTLLGFAMLISMHEVYKALRANGAKPVSWSGYLFCVLAIGSQFLPMFTSVKTDLTIVVMIVSVMSAMFYLVFKGSIAVDRLTATIFPIVYPGIFYVALMRLALEQNRALYICAMIASFFVASVNDVFALFGGMLFGKHKLSPQLSPKKTIEGAISGVIFSILFSMCIPAITSLLLSWDESFMASISAIPPVWALAILGMACGILSQVGDLTASMVKRHCGIKDFGYILPGHGGIMDRLDGVLFCGGACYVFFELYRLL